MPEHIVQIPEWAVFTFRLVLAGLCGAAVGIERELHDKGAGLRTNTLICVGACLFTLVSLKVADFSRVVQGLLVGIGFLGAGVIFRRGESVRGLTTAAGLWVLTAIGLAAGLGDYFLALVGTAFTLVIIVVLKRVENLIHHKSEAELFVADVASSLAGKARTGSKDASPGADEQPPAS